MPNLEDISTPDLMEELKERITDNMAVEDIEPHGDRIFCKPMKEKETSQTDSGLYLVKDDTTREMVFVALSVGPGTVNSPIIDVEEGDILVAGRGSGHDVKVEGDTYVLLPHKDVLGIVKPESIDLDRYEHKGFRED